MLKRVVATTALAVIASYAAPGRAAAADEAAPVPVHIGVIGILAEAGLYTAAEHGFFKDEGLDVEFQRGIFGPQAMAVLATGKIDAVGGAFGIELVNAVQRGVGVRLVASMNNYIPGWDAGYLTVRKALVESGRVKDWKDLKGLKVALDAPQPNITDYFASRYLALGGLTVADVETVNVPFDQMITALKSGGADIAHTSEPLTTIVTDSGIAVKWHPVSDYAPPGLSVALLRFGPSLVEKSPDVGVRLLAGYLRGARYYDNALKSPSGRAEMAEILMKYTPVKDRGLYDRLTFAYAPPDGAITMAGLQDMANYYAAHGGPNAGDVHSLVDDRFREQALAKIGPDKP